MYLLLLNLLTVLPACALLLSKDMKPAVSMSAGVESVVRVVLCRTSYLQVTPLQIEAHASRGRHTGRAFLPVYTCGLFCRDQLALTLPCGY